MVLARSVLENNGDLTRTVGRGVIACQRKDKSGMRCSDPSITVMSLDIV